MLSLVKLPSWVKDWLFNLVQPPLSLLSRTLAIDIRAYHCRRTGFLITKNSYWSGRFLLGSDEVDGFGNCLLGGGLGLGSRLLHLGSMLHLRSGLLGCRMESNGAMLVVHMSTVTADKVTAASHQNSSIEWWEHPMVALQQLQ